MCGAPGSESAGCWPSVRVGVLVNSVSSKLNPWPGIGSIDTRRFASGESVSFRGPSPANGRIALDSPNTSL